jgi:hypothetical protein
VSTRSPSPPRFPERPIQVRPIHCASAHSQFGRYVRWVVFREELARNNSRGVKSQSSIRVQAAEKSTSYWPNISVPRSVRHAFLVIPKASARFGDQRSIVREPLPPPPLALVLEEAPAGDHRRVFWAGTQRRRPGIRRPGDRRQDAHPATRQFGATSNSRTSNNDMPPTASSGGIHWL